MSGWGSDFHYVSFTILTHQKTSISCYFLDQSLCVICPTEALEHLYNFTSSQNATFASLIVFYPSLQSGSLSRLTSRLLRTLDSYHRHMTGRNSWHVMTGGRGDGIMGNKALGRLEFLFINIKLSTKIIIIIGPLTQPLQRNFREILICGILQTSAEQPIFEAKSWGLVPHNKVQVPMVNLV